MLQLAAGPPVIDHHHPGHRAGDIGATVFLALWPRWPPMPAMPIYTCYTAHAMSDGSSLSQISLYPNGCKAWSARRAKNDLSELVGSLGHTFRRDFETVWARRSSVTTGVAEHALDSSGRVDHQ